MKIKDLNLLINYLDEQRLDIAYSEGYFPPWSIS